MEPPLAEYLLGNVFGAEEAWTRVLVQYKDASRPLLIAVFRQGLMVQSKIENWATMAEPYGMIQASTRKLDTTSGQTALE